MRDSIRVLKNYSSRFKDAPWFLPYGRPLDVAIGGAGGIGSWLALILARMGHRIEIWDDDTIEVSNMGGQLYSNQIGSLKVTAVQEAVQYFTPQLMGFHPMGRKIEENAYPQRDICFSCFDKMKPRKLLVEKWYEWQMQKRETGIAKKGDINIFIDGRMEAETAIIYAVRSKSTYERYVEELFTDEELPDNQCSFRATSHNPPIITGFMTSILNNHIVNKIYGEEIREVPFKITYELPTLTFDLKR